MNERDTAKAIEVMQAYADGACVQASKRGYCPEAVWNDSIPNWNWAEFEYRVKPEPREWWIIPEFCGAFSSQDRAKEFAETNTWSVCTPIHVREVLED